MEDPSLARDAVPEPVLRWLLDGDPAICWQVRC